MPGVSRLNGCSARSQAAFAAGYRAAAQALSAAGAVPGDDPATRVAAVERAALQQYDLSQRVAACRDAIGQAESLPEAERRAVVEAVRQALTELDACCDRLQSEVAALIGPAADVDGPPADTDGPSAHTDGSPEGAAAPRPAKPGPRPRTPRRR